VTDINLDQYRHMIDAATTGIVLVDARKTDQPAIYANGAFAALSGYRADEIVGRNLRFLQAEDRDQDGRHRVREYLKRGEGCQVLVRNYRKDGTLFWNEMNIVPLLDTDGSLSHFVGYHRDAGERLRVDPRLLRDLEARAVTGLAAIQRDDRLTGLFTGAYLEELLTRDFAVAQREQHAIAVFTIDIDALELYNATFGRAAGDSAIRRVAYCVTGCLRRASDVTGRIEGGNLVAFAPGLHADQALRVGQLMAERVRDLRIHHPRSTVLRYVSVSVGVAALIPGAADVPADLLRRSRAQLDLAKKSGRNQAV
jgi:diguanylate cyclase (GGDEF)-like protein/PAS domain S-box-containing protein